MENKIKIKDKEMLSRKCKTLAKNSRKDDTDEKMGIVMAYLH